MAIKGSLGKTGTTAIMEHPAGLCDNSSPNQKTAINLRHSQVDSILEDTLSNAKPNKSLTKRETEILRLIIEGNTNKKIAQGLHRSERTVEYHRSRLMRKLGAKTVVDLIKRAIAMGLV